MDKHRLRYISYVTQSAAVRTETLIKSHFGATSRATHAKGVLTVDFSDPEKLLNSTKEASTSMKNLPGIIKVTENASKHAFRLGLHFLLHAQTNLQ